MKLYVFAPQRGRNHLDLSQCQAVIAPLIKNTDTTDLVVACYFAAPGLGTRGTAYIQNWQTPKTFQAARGHWNRTAFWGTPSDLPERFRLIRLHIDKKRSQFPRKEQDIYGWSFEYRSLEDNLALLFAHELHHYRRYHLGLHPREGEHAANKWALEQVQAAGFRVSGQRLPDKTKKKKKRLRFLPDPYAKWRSLSKGDLVVISHDPRARYLGQQATVIRPLRSNARRLVIATADGHTWRWPVEWLE